MFWKWITTGPAVGLLSAAVGREMLITGALAPLFFTDLRAPIDPEVTVSDASETGGGGCVPRELSLQGCREVANLRDSAASSVTRRSV